MNNTMYMNTDLETGNRETHMDKKPRLPNYTNRLHAPHT
jgi:hypothetical protein